MAECYEVSGKEVDNLEDLYDAREARMHSGIPFVQTADVSHAVKLLEAHFDSLIYDPTTTYEERLKLIGRKK